jgi:hypothetical protein
MTTVSMLLGDVTSGYAVKNSLRFRSSASAYLNRTPASASGNYWIIHDTSRDTYNVSTARLYPNASDAEASATDYDILSNGFKLRTTATPNINGSTYIYAAFAENPFNSSRAR